MFVAKKIVQLTPQATRLAVQRRTLISGPPRNRVSFTEKVAHGLFMCVGISVVPLWVLQHLAHYRGEK